MLGGVIIAGIWLFITISSLFDTPTTRLALDKHYSEMPPDEKHQYLILPVDHNDKSSGQFKGFYILSPNFHIGDEVVFFLTDGQMELIDTTPDFSFFDNLLPGLSYVLVFVRGQSPTLFPEVYRRDGSVDYKKALNLYSSDQQIEDAEAVRQDMVEKGTITAEQKIMLMGASGAGILAQQYISKYGQNVSKAILEVTGAPDLSSANNMSYARNLEDYDSNVLKEYELAIEKKPADSADLSYLLYNLARNSIDGPTKLLKMLQSLNNGKKFDYWKCWLKPQCNLALCNSLLSLPSAVAVKVRWWELVGEELRKYVKAGKRPVNLLSEFSIAILGEFLSRADTGEIDSKSFCIERAVFDGEVLVISGNEDIVFSPEIGKILASEYKHSKMALIKDGHRMLASQEYLKRLRKAFFMGGLKLTDFIKAYGEENQLNSDS